MPRSHLRGKPTSPATEIAAGGVLFHRVLRTRSPSCAHGPDCSAAACKAFLAFHSSDRVFAARRVKLQGQTVYCGLVIAKKYESDSTFPFVRLHDHYRPVAVLLLP